VATSEMGDYGRDERGGSAMRESVVSRRSRDDDRQSSPRVEGAIFDYVKDFVRRRQWHVPDEPVDEDGELKKSRASVHSHFARNSITTNAQRSALTRSRVAGPKCPPPDPAIRSSFPTLLNASVGVALLELPPNGNDLPGIGVSSNAIKSSICGTAAFSVPLPLTR
jgi:hypothetical protein